MLCEEFAISYQEFEQIFAFDDCDRLFNALDQNSNGLIDSIEIFTILCIFSDCREEDKMLFLFDVFDFNGRGWLEAADIEFMMFVIV